MKKEKREKNGPKQPKQKLTAKDVALDLLCWLGGCFAYSVSINVFTAPNHIAPGGATGLATVLNYLTGVGIGTLSLLINIPLFLLALKFLGMRFIVRSAIVTVLLSVTLDVGALFLPAYTGDTLLASLFGGLLGGGGLALIFLRRATSGGTDILARLLRLKWPHLSMGKFILAADCIVILISGFVFRSIESVLYAAVVVFIASRAIDQIMYGTGNGKMLMVVTNHANEIAAAVTRQMHRGVTLLPVKGGFTGEEKNMLITAVRNHEVAKVNKIVHAYDPAPFIIISEAGEILGEGFKQGSED